MIEDDEPKPPKPRARRVRLPRDPAERVAEMKRRRIERRLAKPRKRLPASTEPRDVYKARLARDRRRRAREQDALRWLSIAGPNAMRAAVANARKHNLDLVMEMPA